MENTSSSSNGFVDLARSMGRSRFGHLVAALIALAFFVSLAALAIYLPDFFIRVTAIFFVFRGLACAWNLLPIPKLRAYLSRQVQLWKKHESLLRPRLVYKGVFLLWYAGLCAFINLVDGINRARPNEVWVGPIAFVIGLICLLRCQRIVNDAESAEAEANSPSGMQ